MKRLSFLAALLIVAGHLRAQNVGFTYQAVALDHSKAQTLGRDSKGEVLINQDIKILFSIREDIEQGPVVYRELHHTATDIFGIFRVVIGRGENTSDNRLENLAWGERPYFLQVEIDLGEGFILMGIEELMGSPYALNAGKQKLELDGNQLSITGGNSVDLSPFNQQVTENQVDEWVGNNGYLTFENQFLSTNGSPGNIGITNASSITLNVNDADADATNEIQTLSKTGTDLTLSRGGGTISVADNDNDSQNEIQTLTTTGDSGNIGISGSNTLQLNVNDADADPANELQTLTKSGTDITLSQGGGTISVADNDNDSQNEIQDLQIDNGQLSITNNPNATAINLSPYLGENLTEADVDAMVDNNGYLSVEVDGSITNEIQDLSLTNNMLSITNNTNATPIDLTPYQNVFELTNGVISNENGNYASDNFVFGSPQLNSSGNQDHANRFMFDKATGAFRTGGSTNNSWDETNRGIYSTAFGLNALASGNHSIAGGNATVATGASSIALGQGSAALGSHSIALGRESTANSTGTVALGDAAFADSNHAVAIGHSAQAGGSSSVSIGFSNASHAPFTTVLGVENDSWSFGETVMGMFAINDEPNPTINAFDPVDRLFTIGNGSGDMARSDALVMQKSGNTRLHGHLTIDSDNINGAGDPYTLPGQDGAANQVMSTDGNGHVTWSTPATLSETDVDDFVSDNGFLSSEVDGSITNEIQDLAIANDVLSITNNPAPTNIDLAPYRNVFEITNGVTSNENGNYATDDFVFGSPQLADDGNPDHNRRMFFDKSKGAFRAGVEATGDWDDTNVGVNSVAFTGARASGSNSFALGTNAIASGTESVAFGQSAQASGTHAIAFGSSVMASGANSIAAGMSSNASGSNSVAIGRVARAFSYGETAIGTFNTEYTPANTTGFSSGDRLFTIGNGNASFSDALVMLKNGNTRLHGLFTIDADNVTGAGGSYTFPGQRGTNGQVMVTNGSGVLSWSTLLAPAFSTNNNITSNAPGNYASDSFIFGSPNLDYIFGTSSYARAMSFNKSKGSFRAGNALHNGNGTNVGSYSVAFGSRNTASGTGSAAFGDLSIASGSNSFAAGSSNSTASGTSSASFGQGGYAIGDFSFVAGLLTRAGSFGEIALGIANTDVAGNTVSSIPTDRLFSIGNGTNDLNRSDAFVMLKNGNTRLHGQLTIDADNITGAGESYTLPGHRGTNGQVMMTDGSGNVSWTTPAALVEVDGSITNEIQDLAIADDVLTITNNAAPTQIDLAPYRNVFETTSNITSNENGDYANDDFVFGSPQLADDGNTSHDRRMLFDKSKGAFRVGIATEDQWNDLNIGTYSVAAGYNAIARGNHSFSVTGNAAADFSIAVGANSVATGNSSVAIGVGTQAADIRSIAIGGGSATHPGSIILGTGWNQGDYAVALGTSLQSQGNYSMSIGHSSTIAASALEGIAIGNYLNVLGTRGISIGTAVTSYASNEIAFGTFGPSYVPQGNDTDRLFSIANGVSNAQRSHSLVMLKNGNTRLHGQLTIDADNVNGAGGSYTLPGQRGTNGQVMMTDGSGNVSWTTPAALVEVDGSITNEIQDLTITNDVLTITNNATPTQIDLAPYRNVFETTSNITSNQNGDYANDSFIFGGAQLDDDNATTDDNTRMLFEKSTGAFRVGTVTDTRWDAAERGTNSVAMGLGNIARGNSSLSLGQNNLAHSESSAAIGTNNLAEGYNSIALGRNAATTGVHSMAFSLYSSSRSYGETTMGIYATDYVPTSTTNFDASDRLFTIGNGLDDATRSNAFVIFKNGDATLLGTLTDASDMRLKRNIKPLQNSLFSLNNLHGVHYQWNGKKPQDTLALQTGLIAQEVEKIFPELVKTDEEGFKSVNYIGLIPHLIEGIKELKRENQQLKLEKEQRESRSDKQLNSLEARLASLEKLLNLPDPPHPEHSKKE